MLLTDAKTFSGLSAADAMQALDAAGYPADQNWQDEATTWTLPDGSRVRISGPIVEVQEAT